MKDEFYCGFCGKYKKIEFKQQTIAGKRPICKSCNERVERIIAERSEASREQRRAKLHTKGIEHLMPHNEKTE